MKNILLTGGTGFFGKSLLRHCLELQDQGQCIGNLHVLSRNPERFLINNPEFAVLETVSFVKGDILWKKTLPVGMSYDAVIHGAADSTDGPSIPAMMRFDQIVSGTRNLLDFAVRTGAKRFLFISSGAVYGQISPAGAKEDDLTGPAALDPRNVYGISKKTAEHLCSLYMEAYSIETVVARCFAFLGPDLPTGAHFAVGNFIRDALWEDEIVIKGDGTSVRSYLYQADLAKWLIRMLEHGKPGDAYNVGSDEPITIVDLARTVRDIICPGKVVRVLGGASVASDRSIYLPDISKAREVLGLNVDFDLRHSIEITANQVRRSWSR